MKNYYEQMLQSVQHLLVTKSPFLQKMSLAPQLTIFLLTGMVSGYMLNSANVGVHEESPEQLAEEMSFISNIQAQPSGGVTSNSLVDCHSCYPKISLSLHPDCERLITADLLLKDNALALSNPEYYQVRLTVGNGLIISDNTLKIQHVGKSITAMVSYIGPPPCPQGMACMTTIELKNEQYVTLKGAPPLTVYCYDPFLQQDPTSNSYPKPTIIPSCGGGADGPYFGGDWVNIHDCVLGMQDTAKTIYRQWWAQSKDGYRSITFDTIYVLRLPPLSVNNLYCNDKDTLYCGLSETPVGPYILVPDPMRISECDTIYLMDANLQAAPIDPKCGLSIRVDSLVFENTGCIGLRKYTVEVHQYCYGMDKSTCVLPMGNSKAVIEGGGGEPIVAACEFWLVDLDTMPPYITCNQIDTFIPNLNSCESGFTLSHGYWKTHSIFGPAPYDDTWALLPNGENTSFFLSGQTHYELINDVPKGNAYYILAFQYIAARLNFLNGSDPTSVQSEFDQATALFMQYTPAEIAVLKGSNPIRSQFILLGMILDNYNTGKIGPGHCTAGGQQEAIVVAAGPDCIGNFALPKVMSIDMCHDVKLVKAMVEGYGPVIFTYDAATGYWVSKDLIRLPLRPEPYQVVLEAIDECYNVGSDTCAVLVIDNTSPTVVAHSGLTLELPGKIGWINASQIDNNSTDNCGINLVLARRADWVNHWPDFCDSTRFYDQTPEMDTIWCKYVQPNLAISEFEAYYATSIQNFGLMMDPCGLLMYQSWFYDLCKYATVDCRGSLNEADFREAYSAIHPETDVDLVSQIGGGWADKVPFTCADACDSVTVELLVMDFWCNWSTSWTKILVEDKTDATVMADVSPNVTLTCLTYKRDSIYYLTGVPDSLPLADILFAADTGNQEAQTILDRALGGYQKAWIGRANQLVDLEGNVIDPLITFTDRGICVCNPDTIQVRYYDLDSMSYQTKDSIIMICETTEETQMINQGIIAVNCNDNTYCTQDFIYDLDECGLGTIIREFKIWKSCGNEVPDTIKRQQVITFVNTCALNKFMFDLPQDTVIDGCAPVFDPSGNVVGDADPDRTGEPVYTFEKDCRIIATAHEDKVLTLLLPTGQCYAVVRTWYLADWCFIGNGNANWWQQPSLVADSFTQIIVLLDTIAPTCKIEIQGEINDTVSVGTCPGTNLFATFFTFDTCGTAQYTFSLDTLSNPPVTKVFFATGLPGDIRDTMPQQLNNVKTGRYRLVVTIDDHCGNTGMCIDSFVAVCDVNRQAGMVEHHLEQPMSLASGPGKIPIDEPGIVDLENLRLLDFKSSFELYQNRPNPFRANTVIGFNLPDADRVRLTVFDIQGRQLKVFEGSYSNGYNEIELNAMELQATGVLYYQLETTGYTATRRMIVTP